MYKLKKMVRELMDKADFEKTTTHLVTLLLFMEESCWRGKGLNCFLVDFKKAFFMVLVRISHANGRN